MTQRPIHRERIYAERRLETLLKYELTNISKRDLLNALPND